VTRRLRRSKIIGAPNADAADNLGRFSFCQPLWVVLESRYSSHSHGSERHRGRLSYKGQIPRGKCYEEVSDSLRGSYEEQVPVELGLNAAAANHE